ncbi:hypothetical protein [Rhizobium sp. TRM95796]|uniref:hypothetical protein n=1 Tax=Rhizobium sp. TRM95796 TaxID=2979862 RepID=UPI0021E86A02|nr:hypothetical protein [Rhizobium sp. TRM95796]MCV3765092.1 hypothetical protein [Rhizobium sp. TRM95796]
MADILPFPTTDRRPPTSLDSVVSLSVVEAFGPRPLAERSGGDALLRALAICASSPKPSLADLPDAAWVIGTGMRWVARRGRKRASLPKLVADLLERHCDAGDPSAMVFRDWLDCRLPERIRIQDELARGHAEPSSTCHAMPSGGE